MENASKQWQPSAPATDAATVNAIADVLANPPCPTRSEALEQFQKYLQRGRELGLGDEQARILADVFSRPLGGKYRD